MLIEIWIVKDIVMMLEMGVKKNILLETVVEPALAT